MGVDKKTSIYEKKIMKNYKDKLINFTPEELAKVTRIKQKYVMKESPLNKIFDKFVGLSPRDNVILGSMYIVGYASGQFKQGLEWLCEQSKLTIDQVKLVINKLFQAGLVEPKIEGESSKLVIYLTEKFYHTAEICECYHVQRPWNDEIRPKRKAAFKARRAKKHQNQKKTKNPNPTPRVDKTEN